MKILALDSSGLVASAAYLVDGVMVAEYTVNDKLTHSQTLLPMLDVMRKQVGFELTELDAVAAAMGPGSFTGLRIGAATVKGLWTSRLFRSRPWTAWLFSCTERRESSVPSWMQEGIRFIPDFTVLSADSLK